MGIYCWFLQHRQSNVNMNSLKVDTKHITLSPFIQMRVSLAARMLSHSVAAAINTLCALGHLPDEASVTAEFTETFDQLFNAFNSSSCISRHKYNMKPHGWWHSWKNMFLQFFEGMMTLFYLVGNCVLACCSFVF